jgi:hypothetical protein
MLTLIERDFIVNVPLEKAWQHLTHVDQWPTWAQHIKHIEINPGSELGAHSSGVIVLANGIKSTFRMTEFNPGQNWKWVGPFLWMTIHYDHRFEVLSPEQTRLAFVIEASGFGVNVFGRVFAKIYRRNLERAIPLLVSQMENRVTP